MNGSRAMRGLVFAGCFAMVGFVAVEAFGRGGGGGGRGGGGGGGGRGGGGGGGMARPAGGGGGMARPAGGGGGMARPAGGGFSPSPSINRSPAPSAPRVNPPSVSRPSVQPGGPGRPGGPGGGLGAHGGPGNITSPGLSPGTRPALGAGPGVGAAPKLTPGTRPSIDAGRPGIAGKGVAPGVGRPGVAPPIAGKGPGGAGIAGGKGAGVPGIAGGKGGVGPGAGSRPAVLPGLGIGAAGGLAGGMAAARTADATGRRQDRVGNRQENLGDRSQNLQNRLDQRQDFRQQSQGQRQDFRSDRREDWQNWHDDYFNHHNGWYHGGWSGHWGDYWSHMWSDHTAAMVFGTTMWGLNRMGYWFGTESYANPYYTEPLVIDNTVINYSEPLAAPPVSTAPTTAPVITTGPTDQPQTLPPGVTPEGMAQFDAARAAFMSGDYPKALTATNKALASMPKDTVIHEFRALVLFALGNYRESAATLHPVLAVGPGWDWTTMSSLYPDVDTYTKQLRALEVQTREQPKAAESRFVLGYHYLTCGHQERAAKEFTEVQKLVPNDTVTAQLLQMLGKPSTPAPPIVESTAKVDAGELIGTWTASRGSKAQFELTLDKDKGFTWVYQEGKVKQQVKGAYAVDGATLAMEPDAGGVMLAEVTVPRNGSFEFRTVGDPPTEQPLTFRKK